MRPDSPRVAILASSPESRGGVRTVVDFLCQMLERSGRYRPEIVSVAATARDQTSVRLLAPQSWMRGPRVRDGMLGDRPVKHFGAWIPEIEQLRYWPRSGLTGYLNEFDIVQVVAGTPAWAYMTRHVTRPVALHVASLVKVQREGILARKTNPLARGWMWANTVVTARVEAAALSLVDACFVMNHEMTEYVSARLGPERVVFAPPGIDTDIFYPLGAGDGQARTPYILCVGRFAAPRKNVALLFRAYAKLRQDNPDTPRLVLAGRTAPLPADLAVAESLGIRGHVDIRTEVPFSELPALYRNAEMFVLSSDEEGLGLVLVEAMASGVPVVCTKSAGPATIIQDGVTGLLTPVGDADALSEAMARVLRDRTLRDGLAQRGYQRARDVFSRHATERAFLRAYDELLDGRWPRVRR